MLKRYIEALKMDAKAATRKSQAAQSLQTQRQTYVKPLTVQIDELMRSLPPSIRDRAWAMEDLVGRLQGRYSARPHAANVGQALRALGWMRKRDWSASGHGRRVWERCRHERSTLTES